jgi:PAS domain S-box-containing protein
MYALGSTALRAGLLSDDDSIVKAKKVRSFIKHRNIEKEFAGSRGFGFIRPMTQAEVPDYFALNKNDPEYPKSVISLTDQAPNSGDIYLIEVIGPLIKNKAALGLDIASDPVRKLAATVSAASGSATLTGPLSLTQVNNPKTIGFLMLTPVYKDGVPLTTPEERTKNLIGWTYAAFQIEELLATAQLHTEMMSLTILDISKPDYPEKVFSNNRASIEEHPEGQNPLAVATNLNLFGRTWQVIALPTDAMTNTFSRRHIHWMEIWLFVFLLSAACIGLYFFIKWNLIREKNRKDDLHKLEESEKRWRDMANSLPQLVWTCDNKGHCDYLSTRWEQYTGIASDKQLGEKWLAQVHPDDKKELVKKWSEATQTHTVFSAEFRIRRFDGEYRWFDTRATPLFDEGGNVSRWVGSNTDIQIQKEVQNDTLYMNNYLEALVEERTRELSKAERRTKKILDTVPLLIGYWDTTLHNVFANHAYEDWFGVSRHQIPGISMRDLLPPASYQRSLPRTQEVLRGIPQKFVNKFPDLNGNGERFGLVDMLPDEIDGNIVGFFVCMLDVTDIQKAREAAFASSAAKSRFMATIAHEIRNPLNGVLGSASILMDDLPDGDLKSSIAEIKDSAKSMRVILDDLLDMTAFESGRLSLEKIPFELYEVLTASTSIHQTIAQKKNVKFDLRIEPEGQNIKVLGDPTRFKQLVQNLISNAVKFTSAGQINCHVKIGRTDLERCVVHIVIKDTGIGIPANKISTLFTPFVQTDVSNFREFGGSGLGLSITKSLVEAMGGDITVRSQVGEGTEMEVCIPFNMDALDVSPLALKSSDPIKQPEPLEQKKLSCLVIDDMALNRKIFKHILLRDGHEVDLADSGKSALTLCNKKKFDLIISDIDMPEMSGYEFTRLLRKNKKCKNQDTPIIACSGFATVSDIRKALSHGMNGHIAKPLDPDTVRTEISRWMNRFKSDTALSVGD